MRDAGDIAEAEEQLDEGDVHRADGRLADAAEAYADAVSTAVYQPSTGRFLTRDPIQPNHPGTQGWNHYTYTTNNPTALTDPAGLASLFENALIKSAIQGAVLGGASGLGAGLVACQSVRGVDQASCVVSAALIGGITGGIFGFRPGSWLAQLRRWPSLPPWAGLGFELGLPSPRRVSAVPYSENRKTSSCPTFSAWTPNQESPKLWDALGGQPGSSAGVGW